MKIRLLCFAVLLFSAASLPGAVEKKGNQFLLTGKAYRLALHARTGAIEKIEIRGKAVPLTSHRRGLWQAKLADGKMVVGSSQTKRSAKLLKDGVVFFFDDPRIAGSVTVTAHPEYVDFQSRVTAKTQPVLEFGAPGRLTFDPETLAGFTASLGSPRNFGITFNNRLFRKQTELGDGAAGMTQSRPVGGQAYQLLFGGKPVTYSAVKPSAFPVVRGEGAEAFFDEAMLGELGKLKIFADRPFGKNQAEIVFLRDAKGDAVFGGSRFGGKGAFIRPAGMTMSLQHGDRFIELYSHLIAKRKRGEKAARRNRIVLLAYSSSAIALPKVSRWIELLKKHHPEVETITTAAELQSVLADPKTAVIINPAIASCWRIPGLSMTEQAAKIRDFVKQGGYWLDGGGYSFYKEIVPVEYASVGRQTVPGATADFFHFSFEKRAPFVIYGVQVIGEKPFDPSSIYQPAVFQFGGMPDGGYLDRNTMTCVKPGQTLTMPVTRWRFNIPALEAARALARDNKVIRPLAAKAKPEVLDKAKRSILFDADETGTPAKKLLASLDKLPTPIIFHIVRYMKGGFDKEYPDMLPPHPRFGSPQELRGLIDACHARGMLVMPYTNNTWWCSRPAGPTYRKYGDAPLLRNAQGKTVMENYAGNTGYTTTMWHPAAQEACRKIVNEFTRDYPVDILFQDQTGARSARYDENPAAPASYAYVEGLLSAAKTDSKRIPLATEEGWYGIFNEELFSCGLTLGLESFWYRHPQLTELYPQSFWTLFPLHQTIGHETTLMTHHNGASVNTPRRVALTLAAGYGFTLQIHVMPPSPRDLGWLNWLDRLQKSISAAYAGTPVAAFHHEQGKLGQLGVIHAQYGPVKVTANLSQEPYRMDDMTLAPDGFRAEGPNVKAGCVLKIGKMKVKTPASFVVEGNDVYFYAKGGEEVIFPAKKDWKVLKGPDGKLLPLEASRGAAQVTLPKLPSRDPQLFHFRAE